MPDLPSAAGTRDSIGLATQPPDFTHKPKLLEQVRTTEEAYLQWIRRFILFHGKRHPVDLGATEIDRFLSHLAVDGAVSASTQNDSLVPLAHPAG